MTEFADVLLRANAVGAAAILGVLAVRLPARWAFGPEAAYRLWAAPPLAVFACLLPFKVSPVDGVPLSRLASEHAAPLLIVAWAAGLTVAVALLARAQARFLKAARRGLAGPAVVGVISPRILMPPDDGRYSPLERDLIRAHEREHIRREDHRAGALAAAFQCVCWFNPLAHVAAHLVRLDQELACDAAVLRRRPKDRALYAKTLLKTQLAGALPLGCCWPASGKHPLELRVELLRRGAREGGLAGGLVVAAGLAAAAGLATAAEPPLKYVAPDPIGIYDQQPPSGHMSVMLVTWRASAARR